MFRCDDSLVQMYIDGELAQAERMIMRDHIELCPRCRVRAGAYKGLFWDLEHPEPGPEPGTVAMDALSERMMAAWRQHLSESRQRVHGRWPALSTLWLTANPVALAAAGVIGRSPAKPRAHTLLRSGLSRLAGLFRRGGGSH